MLFCNWQECSAANGMLTKQGLLQQMKGQCSKCLAMTATSGRKRPACLLGASPRRGCVISDTAPACLFGQGLGQRGMTCVLNPACLLGGRPGRGRVLVLQLGGPLPPLPRRQIVVQGALPLEGAACFGGQEQNSGLLLPLMVHYAHICSNTV